MKTWRTLPPELSARYRSRGWWRDKLLWHYVERWAREYPEKHAVIDETGSYSYRELADLSTTLLGGLAGIGVNAGDVVAIQTPPIKEFVPTFLAAERRGSVVVPIVPGVTGTDLEQIVQQAKPSVFVAVGQHRRNRPAQSAIECLRAVGSESPVVAIGDELPGAALSFEEVVLSGRGYRPGPSPSADVIAELAFTSGTTGEPKGVLHTHNSSLAGIGSTLLRQQLGPSDVVHVALPVGHNFGYFYGVRLALMAGATLILQRSWNPLQMLDLCGEYGVTVSAGTPTHVSDLLDVQTKWHRRLDTLRLFTCAGARMPEDLACRAIDLMPGRLSRAFGMTEVGHISATSPDTPAGKVLTTEGRPQPEVEVCILGDGDSTLSTGNGEIAVRGPFLFAGYYHRAMATASVMTQDGFFRTGDLGFIDDDGYLVITGRAKELLVRGGENISLNQMEEALAKHQDIADVAVVALPDRRLGERPVACIRGVYEHRPSLEDLQMHLQALGLSKLYWPEARVFVEEIPRKETGKVNRQALRDLLNAEGLFEREG